MDTIKSELKSKFDTQDLGELNHFIGIKISCDRITCTIAISQDQYIRDILERAGMLDCNPVSTPMAPKCNFIKFDGP